MENAALPLMLAGMDRDEAVARARQWCQRLGLQGLEDRRPGMLSGGQAQRVAIARALAPGPKVLFADEPTGALDRRTGQETMRLLTDSARQSGASLVVVTHDPSVAAFCSRTLSIVDGRIVGERAAVPAGGNGRMAADGYPAGGAYPVAGGWGRDAR